MRQLILVCPILCGRECHRAVVIVVVVVAFIDEVWLLVVGGVASSFRLVVNIIVEAQAVLELSAPTRKTT